MQDQMIDQPPTTHGLLGTANTFLMLVMHSFIEAATPLLSLLCLIIGIVSGIATIIATTPKAVQTIRKIKKRFKSNTKI